MLDDEGMHEFTSEDNWEIAGRGPVYGIPAAQMPADMWDPVALTGQTVRLDGERVVVRGVQTFAITRSPESPYRLSFALLVEKVEVDS